MVIPKPKIIVIGGGISGLTVCHELINKGFHVKLFEKDNMIGGMARSRREFNGSPSEHSWRGYGPFFNNFFDIAKRIPIYNNKTVYDNLTVPIDFHLLRDRISTYKPKLTITDYIIVLYYGLKYLVSNKRRKDYYKTKLVPLLKNKLSENGYDYLINFVVGPGLGMEKKDVSYGHFFKVPTMQNLNKYKHKHKHTLSDNDNEYYHISKNWHVMNQPTNEGWFIPWVKYLTDRGLEVYLNTELIRINHTNNKITSCVFNNGYTNEIIVGDEYVLCINPFEAEKIFQKSGMYTLYNQHKLLNMHTDSNQISFRIGINKKIKFPKSVAFAMTDSEFNITWYPQENHWKNDIKLDNNDIIKSLWSGTIIVTYEKGKIYNKKAIDLNKKELMDEIIYQILRSKSFQKLIYKNNNFKLTTKDIVYTEIWYEWKQKNGLKSDAKKWVNNAYNEEYRPLQQTLFKNLYLAGAHTKTTIEIWSMEGAVESGKVVSNYISHKYNKGYVHVYKHLDPGYFKLFKYIDDIVYKFHLPNIVDIVLLFVVILIILISYYYIKLKHKL